ncbi:MAG: hypothetical protein EA381_17440 [Planctomycetaceae bacterium]|nr:MAG: hypothetical protein EA381_17440 [Planctomycetaceae bacterium]
MRRPVIIVPYCSVSPCLERPKLGLEGFAVFPQFISQLVVVFF